MAIYHYPLWMYYSKQVYSHSRKFKKIISRISEQTRNRTNGFLSSYAPKLKNYLLGLWLKARWNWLVMFKAGFTVLTLLVFSYAVIFAENFQAYDKMVLANWSGLDEQTIQQDDVFAIDLESVVVDESDDLWARKITYTVRRGDTPWQIARQFWITTKNLKLVNNIDWDTLKPWQKLVITPVEWFVVENALWDVTISQYAANFGLDLADLKELNDYVSDQDIIKKWYELFIPLTEEEWIRIGMIAPEVKPVETYKPTTPVKNTNNAAKSQLAAKKPAAKQNNSVAAKSVKRVWKAYFSRAETASYLGFASLNCTSYVARKKPAIAKAIRKAWWWHGGARGRQAAKAWLSVGKEPVVWSIWVQYATRSNRYGHVGIVTSFSKTEVCMNNANVEWLWVVSQNCFPRSTFSSFIYD